MRVHAQFFRLCGIWVTGLGPAWRHGEQLARPCDVGGAIAVGEQAVVANAMEAFRQRPWAVTS
jgi:hypothetical protein